MVEDKSDEDSRPDQPTDSQGATLAQRGEGSHAEYADAPASMSEAEGDTETQERDPDRAGDVDTGAGPSDEPDPEHVRA